MTTNLPPDRYVKVGDVNTRYWSMGEQGSNLVMIHGLGGFAETWVENVAALAHRHRVYVLDLVGFGRSDKPPISYSIENLALFLRDFMATQEIENATLMGNSMGGAVALQFTLLHPEQVEALVLVSSAGFGTGVPWMVRVATMPVLGELLLRPTRRAAKWIMKGVLYDPDRIPDSVLDVGFETLSTPPARRAILKTVRSMIRVHAGDMQAYASLQEALSRLNTPTLIVWGSEDSVLPVEHAHIANQTLPNTILQVYDRCGHMPQVERAEEFNALVLDFMAKLEGS
ncbi:MAG: alpha/beta fold hydrolase [Anaerolineales bacterium]|jgi:4,5:9,10-diseco-3-hydroxy-5,9,17-trioxoandrosta-1(10),2-diene-4-oate hydrolase